MAQSRDQQVTVVVEGLALGTLASGVVAINAGKLTFELAIEHALHDWSHAAAFPSLTTHLGPNALWLGIGRSPQRRWAHAAWRKDSWLIPYIMTEGWSVEDCTDVLSELGPAKHAGWVELAETFLSRLGEHNMTRA